MLNFLLCAVILHRKFVTGRNPRHPKGMYTHEAYKMWNR